MIKKIDSCKIEHQLNTEMFFLDHHNPINQNKS